MEVRWSEPQGSSSLIPTSIPTSLPTDEDRERERDMTLLLREALNEADADARGVKGSRDTECRGVGITIGANEWRRPTWASVSNRTASAGASTMPPMTSPSLPQQRWTQVRSRAICESAQYAVADGVVAPVVACMWEEVRRLPVRGKTWEEEGPDIE